MMLCASVSKNTSASEMGGDGGTPAASAHLKRQSCGYEKANHKAR
jgi:hypothetical protein